MTPARYSYHHAARNHTKGGRELGTLLRGSLKCETHFRLQAKSFGKYQMSYISGGLVFVHGKNGLKAADFFN